MRAYEEFEYFFEIDGERRYDFDNDFNRVEIVQGTSSMPMTQSCATTMAPVVPGQIIIANTIQICEPAAVEDPLVALSTASSCSSSFGGHATSSDFDEDWEVSGPVVSWPSAALSKLLAAHLLVQPKPIAPPPTGFSKCSSDVFNGAQNNQNTAPPNELTVSGKSSSLQYSSYNSLCGYQSQRTTLTLNWQLSENHQQPQH